MPVYITRLYPALLRLWSASSMPLRQRPSCYTNPEIVSLTCPALWSPALGPWFIVVRNRHFWKQSAILFLGVRAQIFLIAPGEMIFLFSFLHFRIKHTLKYMWINTSVCLTEQLKSIYLSWFTLFLLACLQLFVHESSREPDGTSIFKSQLNSEVILVCFSAGNTRVKLHMAFTSWKA